MKTRVKLKTKFQGLVQTNQTISTRITTVPSQSVFPYVAVGNPEPPTGTLLWCRYTGTHRDLVQAEHSVSPAAKWSAAGLALEQSEPHETAAGQESLHRGRKAGLSPFAVAIFVTKQKVRHTWCQQSQTLKTKNCNEEILAILLQMAPLRRTVS